MWRPVWPSFAEEVVAKVPIGCVAGWLTTRPSPGEAARQLYSVRFQDITPTMTLICRGRRCGQECAGHCHRRDGLGLGLNSRAALMTRGLAEIARLGRGAGAERQTFMGLAGMGDRS